MISDTFGFAGSRELAKFAKTLRLDLDWARNQGDAADEHYMVPASKHPNMAARGATIATPEELRSHFAAKRDRRKFVATPTSRLFDVPDNDQGAEVNERFVQRQRERSRDRGRVGV